MHARIDPLAPKQVFLEISWRSSRPHGKRQRAREAGLWAVDPPSYFTEGTFVRLVGPLYTAEQRVAIERRFPEWSPQRHMHMDAIQRAAVRDVLALATAIVRAPSHRPRLLPAPCR